MDLFDGERFHQGVHLVFSDSVVVAIEKRKKRYKSAEIIDGSGQTVLPPLINAHVHVRNEHSLKEAQEAGVFALLDMFSTDARAASLRHYRDSLKYARLYSSQVGATVPGGHGTQFGVEIPILGPGLSPKTFVQDRIKAGADYIKICQESSKAQLNERQTQGLIDESHRLGRIAVAHISETISAITLVGQGIDGLAHLWYRKGSFADSSLVAAMQQKGTFVIPTLSVIQRVIDQGKEAGRSENYLSETELFEEVSKLHKAGIPLLAGTDSPNFGMDYGPQLYEELKLLEGCGLSIPEVLRTATLHVYQHFSLEGLGMLEKGAPASFILIDGKVRSDLEELYREKRMWKWGLEIG